jgi:hypothetical protein
MQARLCRYVYVVRWFGRRVAELLATQASAAPTDEILSYFGGIVAAERLDLFTRSSFVSGTAIRYTSEARKLARASQPSSRSSKPADDSKSRFATIIARSCRAWQTPRSIESLHLPVAPGRLEINPRIHPTGLPCSR